MDYTEALRKVAIQLFMQEALQASLDSDDIHHQTGCCIVDSNDVIIATGCNKLLAGCTKTQDRLERPMKYLYIEHAERTAIFAAYNVKDVDLTKCTMYIMWFPCADCTRAIIESGIKAIVCNKPDLEDDRWGASFKASIEMLNECRVQITYVDNNFNIIP